LQILNLALETLNLRSVGVRDRIPFAVRSTAYFHKR
jgi:hypothetical protein